MNVSQRLCGALLVLAAAACSGPERVPHQPIPGVDTRENQVDNPHDRKEEPPAAATNERPAPPAPAPESAPAGDADFLQPFTDKVLAAVRAQQGIVAVFPALSPSPTPGKSVVNGLGEHLAERTAWLLEQSGATGILAGDRLVNDLKAVNRSPNELAGADDIWWMAERVGAGYVIYGRAERVIFDRTKRDEHLAIDWQCRRMSDRSLVAQYRVELDSGALAERLQKYYDKVGRWPAGTP